ncbi:MAG: cytochrome c [Crocinitomicaceae bacterium]|nr:cytochrome c [Crocinitomicaceae bacterium]
MQRFLLPLFTLACVALAIMSFRNSETVSDYRRLDVSERPLEEILKELGGKPLIHEMEAFDNKKAKIGEDLIFNGRTTKDGKKSKLISTYFVCTDCHNTTREFTNLEDQSSANRLAYAEKAGIPYLPGSTLWGIYNRRSFYNGDYVKKYGDLVTDARDSLENSIQVCSKYCSSGRYLDDWELEAIMHYFKKGEIKVKDLTLDEDTKNQLYAIRKMKGDDRLALRRKIEGSYSQRYDATFLETTDRNKRQYGANGNVKNGALIYKKACMFCHENKRVTYLHLDEGKLSGKMFWSKIKGYSDLSLYQIIRHGTYAKSGRKQYMPLFTEEKLSDEQLNDLVAYIKQIAGK